MRHLSVVLVAGVLIACTRGDPSATDEGSCPAEACAGLPLPSPGCVGGVPAAMCKPRAAAGCRWQIDCVTPDKSAPPDMRGLSPCDAAACGAEPAWDESDCVYGFVPNAPAQCESIDRAACAWSRRCAPKPCSVEEGTCNVLDYSRLGRPCDGSTRCPDDGSCVSFGVNLGESVGPVCIQDPPCSILTCAPGTRCVGLLSYPAQIGCSSRP